jgi:hypothetical protein
MEVIINKNRYLITTNATNEVLKNIYEIDPENFNSTLEWMYEDLKSKSSKEKMIKLYVESLEMQKIYYNNIDSLKQEMNKIITKSTHVIKIYLQEREKNEQDAIVKFFKNFPQNLKLTLCKILDDNKNINDSKYKKINNNQQEEKQTNDEIIAQINTINNNEDKKKKKNVKNKQNKMQNDIKAKKDLSSQILNKIINNIQKNIKKYHINLWKQRVQKAKEQSKKRVGRLSQVIENIDKIKNQNSKQQTINLWRTNNSKINIINSFLQKRQLFSDLSTENKEYCLQFIIKNIHFIRMLYGNKNYKQKTKNNISLNLNLNSKPYNPMKK